MTEPTIQDQEAAGHFETVREALETVTRQTQFASQLVGNMEVGSDVPTTEAVLAGDALECVSSLQTRMASLEAERDGAKADAEGGMDTEFYASELLARISSLERELGEAKEHIRKLVTPFDNPKRADLDAARTFLNHTEEAQDA